MIVDRRSQPRYREHQYFDILVGSKKMIVAIMIRIRNIVKV